MSDPAPAPRSAMSSKAMATVVVVSVFVAGILIGGIADRIYLGRSGRLIPAAHSRDSMIAHLVDRFDRDLHLTPAQRQQITAILTAHRQRIDAIWATVHPQVRTEIDATNAEIAKLLTRDQRTKFDQMRARMDARRRHRGNRVGPRPAPGRGPGAFGL